MRGFLFPWVFSLGLSLEVEQSVEATSGLEPEQIVSAADMFVADENLRHRVTSAGFCEHVSAFLRNKFEVVFLPMRDAFFAKQSFCAFAVGAVSHRVEQYVRHDWVLSDLGLRGAH